MTDLDLAAKQDDDDGESERWQVARYTWQMLGSLQKIVARCRFPALAQRIGQAKDEAARLLKL